MIFCQILRLSQDQAHTEAQPEIGAADEFALFLVLHRNLTQLDPIEQRLEVGNRSAILRLSTRIVSTVLAESRRR